MNNLHILIILLNLSLLNVFIIDIFQLINKILIDIETKKNTKVQLNIKIMECNLNCNNEINVIKLFYENISQFKYIYNFAPLKIKKINNNTCQILYNNIHNSYNTISKMSSINIYKDIREFQLNSYLLNYQCYWYVSDMSPSLLTNN